MLRYLNSHYLTLIPLAHFPKVPLIAGDPDPIQYVVPKPWAPEVRSQTTFSGFIRLCRRDEV